MKKLIKYINNKKEYITFEGTDTDYALKNGFIYKDLPETTKETNLKAELENKFYEVYPLYKQCNIAIYGTEEERQQFKEFHDRIVGEYDEKIKELKNANQTE